MKIKFTWTDDDRTTRIRPRQLNTYIILVSFPLFFLVRHTQGERKVYVSAYDQRNVPLPLFSGGVLDSRVLGLTQAPIYESFYVVPRLS